LTKLKIKLYFYFRVGTINSRMECGVPSTAQNWGWVNKFEEGDKDDDAVSSTPRVGQLSLSIRRKDGMLAFCCDRRMSDRQNRVLWLSVVK
jgi:hypothetical protein